MANYRTVWVLGAGFSKPLGGPLLPDLFSPASRDRLSAAYGTGDRTQLLFSDLAEQVRRLYAEHGRESEVRQRHWEDAEQFLEALDTAAVHGAGSPMGGLILALSTVRSSTPSLEVDLAAMAAMARRLVAAECCAFLKGGNPASEKWGPFTRWLHSLGEHDSVITFNYDTVIETLARETKFTRLVAALPGTGVADAPSVNLFKLHGSVNWHYDGTHFRQVIEDDEFALTCPADQMVIASPGPAKLATTERLRDLWASAESVLRNATAVVFIGYRFPPSDSSSRRRLFMALVQNDQPYLALHTVLGPNTSDPATARVRSLLLAAARQGSREEATKREGTDYQQGPPRHYTLDVHPLWGEDFMDVFVSGHVFQAYRFPRA